MESGEWVEVKTLQEIQATLDEGRKFRGLIFMPEMERFCGQRFRVFKTIKTIKLETTGEVRRVTTPIVSLEGVYCTGEQHEGCDRSCFHFWSEAWLKRMPEEEALQDTASVSAI